MGLYTAQVLPRVTEWLLDKPRIHQLRVETAQPLSGRVVEIGFGSGLNLPALPESVNALYAVDPDQVGRRLAGARIDNARVEVHFTGRTGESIPLDAGSMDGALSTFTMCSIPDLQRALAEMKRVLAVGGRLCFMEHGQSPVPRIARWQRRINPFYSPLSGGCRLDLRVAEAVREAGFEIVNIDSFELGKKPGLATHIVRGVAIKT